MLRLDPPLDRIIFRMGIFGNVAERQIIGQNWPVDMVIFTVTTIKITR